MKIATWNLERLKHKKQLDQIVDCCEQVNADIMILTDTDDHVQLNYKNCFQTPNLSELDPIHYKPTENRVSIFTNYNCVAKYSIYDVFTSLCVELETELGNLLVYGTVIGIYGSRDKYGIFIQDLKKQIADFQRLSADKNICIAGNFNLSFADDYYFTHFGRKTLLESFANTNIELLTKNQLECIDHIAISKNFVADKKFNVNEWNLDKSLSDHKGVSVNLNT